MQEQQKNLVQKLLPTQQLKFTGYINNKITEISINDKHLTAGDVKINVYDMIGLVQKKIVGQDLYQYTLNYFPKIKKMFKSQCRYVCSFQFVVKGDQNWKHIQQAIIYKINNRNLGDNLKILICFNPNAGANSKKHLDKILNFIKLTNLEPEVFTTNHRNHCVQHLKTVNKNDYCAIAIVSGDGLMHEYVNSFCQVPVTHVPAGSGNAFAKTQMEMAKQACKDQESIFLVIKNNIKKFNIVKYQLEKLPTPIYSFLSLEWALIADLDMNSEFLRCIGGLRYQVYAVWLVLRMKRYRGRLIYSTIQKQMPAFDVNLEQNPNYITIQDDFIHLILCSIPYISDKYQIAPLLDLSQQFIDLQMMRANTGRYQLTKYLLSSESGSHFNKQQKKPSQGFNFQHRFIKSFRLQPLDPNMPGIFGIDGEAYESQKIQGSFTEKYFYAFV